MERLDLAYHSIKLKLIFHHCMNDPRMVLCERDSRDIVDVQCISFTCNSLALSLSLFNIVYIFVCLGYSFSPYTHSHSHTFSFSHLLQKKDIYLPNAFFCWILCAFSFAKSLTIRKNYTLRHIRMKSKTSPLEAV